MDYYERLMEERKVTNRKKRVAAYCRVSTDHEDQENSFESQQRYFRHFIEHHNDWELYQIFADEGLSGTTTKKRKEFNRMVECALHDEFDLILTKEVTRFARNTLDSIYYTRMLKKHGVGVIFMIDGINTLDGDAELRLSIMASIAQDESRKTSERVKWGQKRQMEQGVVFGRDLLGYDVKDGKMSINEEGAKIVRLIFHKFVDEKKGTHVIARELLEEGIYPMRIKRWTNTVILRVLRNEKYCGDLVQKKTYTPDFLTHEKKYNRGQEDFVILRNHHEPIISRDYFEEAARILAERNQSRKGQEKHSNRYAFSGKIKCGVCGASFVARYRTRGDGSIYKAWRCYEAAAHGHPHTDQAGNSVGCSGVSIRNEDAVHIMKQVLASLAVDRQKICDELVSMIQSVIGRSEQKEQLGLEQQKQCLEEKRVKLIELYTSGLITKDEFLAEREKSDLALQAVQKQTRGIENRIKLNSNQDNLMCEIRKSVSEMLSGVQEDDCFYRNILEKMVVLDRNHIDVYLKFLPKKWSFIIEKATENLPKKAEKPFCGIVDASIPTSVIMPAMSR